MNRATKTVGVIMAAAAMIGISACGTTSNTTTPATSAPGGTGAPGTALGALPEYAKTLQTQIPEAMKANAIPGVVVLIKSRDKGDWSTTFGTREIGKNEPMRADDYFRIGSNTKTMTSTVILQLVQEGKLKLDDPISKYRPDVPNGDKITIANLSEMRSGLYSYTSDLGFNETLDKEPQKAWTPDELLKIAFAHPNNAGPGEEFEYNNTNIVLLGVVIEQLTGQTLAEAFQKRIFEPLGLKQTSLPAANDSSIPDPHPQGYQFMTNAETVDGYAVPAADLPGALAGTFPPINQTAASPSWAWAAGGAISTPSDLAIYAKALVGGGLLDEKTQALRLDSIKPINPANPSVGYGLGIVEFAPNVFGHDGQIPGNAVFMVHDAKTETTIIIGTNLAATPVDGNNSSVVIGKVVMSVLYGAAAVPGGDPAGAPKGTTAPGTPGTTGPTGTTGSSAPTAGSVPTASTTPGTGRRAG